MESFKFVQQTKKFVLGSLPGSRCQGYRFRKEDRRPKLLETGAVGRVQGYKRDQQDLLEQCQ
jgi:hypothetical protein